MKLPSIPREMEGTIVNCARYDFVVPPPVVFDGRDLAARGSSPRNPGERGEERGSRMRVGDRYKGAQGGKKALLVVGRSTSHEILDTVAWKRRRALIPARQIGFGWRYTLGTSSLG